MKDEPYTQEERDAFFVAWNAKLLDAIKEVSEAYQANKKAVADYVELKAALEVAIKNSSKSADRLTKAKVNLDGMIMSASETAGFLSTALDHIHNS
jgi:hypothetical protein